MAGSSDKIPKKIEKVESWMFRVSGENPALLFSVSILLVIGFIFSLLNLYIFLLFFIGGVVYVRLQHTQYMGNAVRVHSNQFPEIYEIFKSYAIKLGIPKAALYIVQDPYLNAYTIGMLQCSIVLTSALIEQFSPEEISFVIAHELGHFKAGHTKITTLINPIGVNNVFAYFIFGFWDRKTEYSCDRCGLILTRDIDNAISSLIKLSVGGELFKKLNIKGYATQVKKAIESPIKLSEIFVSHPLTINRIEQLIVFWRESFVE